MSSIVVGSVIMTVVLVIGATVILSIMSNRPPSGSVTGPVGITPARDSAFFNVWSTYPTSDVSIPASTPSLIFWTQPSTLPPEPNFGTKAVSTNANVLLAYVVDQRQAIIYTPVDVRPIRVTLNLTLSYELQIGTPPTTGRVSIGVNAINESIGSQVCLFTSAPAAISPFYTTVLMTSCVPGVVYDFHPIIFSPQPGTLTVYSCEMSATLL